MQKQNASGAKLLLSSLGLLGGFLKSSTDLEGHSLGSLDLDGSASLRIAAGTGSTFLNGEGTETDQLNETVLLDTSGDAVENSVNSAASSGWEGV